MAKTFQDSSLLVIRTQSKAEKKKVEEPKDSAITLVPSPHNSLVLSINATLLLPRSPQVQVVDLGDEGSSDNESIKLDEATKKTSEVEKSQGASMLISHVPKNLFSSTVKEITLIKRKMFSIDSLRMASKVIGTESWLEDTLEKKRKRKDEGAPNKEALSLLVHSRSTLSKVKK